MRNVLLVLAFIGFGIGMAFQFGVVDLDKMDNLVDEVFKSDYYYDDYAYDDYDEYGYLEDMPEPGITFADYLDYELVDLKYNESDAAFLEEVQGLAFPYLVAYSNIGWGLSLEDYNPDAEIEITHKYSDLYSLVIAENVDYDLAEYRQTILDNFATDESAVNVLYEGEREIDGKVVQEMVANVGVEDYDFQYHLYYYTSPEGSLQFVVYYEDYLAEVYNDDVSKLLNSLRIF